MQQHLRESIFFVALVWERRCKYTNENYFRTMGSYLRRNQHFWLSTTAPERARGEWLLRTGTGLQVSLIQLLLLAPSQATSSQDKCASCAVAGNQWQRKEFCTEPQPRGETPTKGTGVTPLHPHKLCTSSSCRAWDVCKKWLPYSYSPHNSWTDLVGSWLPLLSVANTVTTQLKKKTKKKKKTSQ